MDKRAAPEWTAYIKDQEGKIMDTDIPSSLMTGEIFRPMPIMRHASSYSADDMKACHNFEKTLRYRGFIKYRDIFERVWVREFHWVLMLLNYGSVCSVIVQSDKEWEYKPKNRKHFRWIFNIK